MKVLLTGASGGVGSKFMEMYPDTIPVSVRAGDQVSMAQLSYELRNADVLIHAGAILNPRSHRESSMANVILPLDILEIAEKMNPRLHVILLSSMSMLDEHCKVKPISDMSLYAASKYIMEEFSKQHSGVPATIVRFSTLFYGDPERDGLSKIIYTAKTMSKIVAADCRRDFLPIENACEMLNILCCNHRWYNRTVNLCTGQSYNMLDIAKYLEKTYSVAFHHTSLPSYEHICYKFDPTDSKHLVNSKIDIYKLIDKYYNNIKESKNGKTA